MKDSERLKRFGAFSSLADFEWVKKLTGERLAQLTCETCGGKGRVVADVEGEWGIDTCAVCHGSGTVSA